MQGDPTGRPYGGNSEYNRYMLFMKICDPKTRPKN